MSNSTKNLYTLDNNKSKEGASRKMAAIFAADVVGYSKLMAANEKLTLFRLKETRKITDKIIHDLDGRIFSTAGDSIMAEFASPVDAVEAAINIQKEVEKNLEDTNDTIRIEFRMGINLGDIMIQDNNLYGDNVNIAARLESISHPGEICISEKVYLEVNNKVDIKFKYFGEKKLKNISQKVKVYISNLNAPDEVNSRKKYLSITNISIFSVIMISLIGGYFAYNKFFNQEISYSNNTKSVLEDFKTTNEDVSTRNAIALDGRVAISLMEIQNQSNNITQSELKTVQDIISSNLSNGDKIVVVSSPPGAENLNPPEVMLIATEANASFIINGITNTEGEQDFLNIKIYESKRGSLIINEKLIIKKDDNYQKISKFFETFKKNIVN